MLCRSHVLIPLLTGLIFLGGCNGGSDDNSDDTSDDNTQPTEPEVIDTSDQEAAYALFSESRKNGDWAKVIDSLTPESRSLLLGMTAIGAWNIAQEDEQLLTELKKKLQTDYLIDITKFDEIPDGAKGKELVPIATQIGSAPLDKQTAFKELSEWILLNTDEQNKPPRFYAVDEDKEHELTEIYITKTNARGQLLIKDPETDETAKRPIVFTLNRAEGIWQVDLLATDSFN